ncbi:MAG: hypothetical protein EXS31_13365 [Pedosphaera sp.]|nr:hypothetical protein [Pedosphaera sp.]
MKKRLLTFVMISCCWTLRIAAADVDSLIQWLMEDERDLKGIPFGEVVRATTGHKINPLQATNEEDQVLLRKIGGALDRVLVLMNAASSPAQKERRINEASSHFEDAILKELNTVKGFYCEFPKTTSGRTQRSGYPDLRLTDKTSGRIVYLDPKLYEQGGRASTFRTFYFEPKKETNKIHNDAHHLIVGIEHDGRQGAGWKFLRWELIDLSRFKVRLKAEFQGSNRDLYQPGAVVGASVGNPSSNK